MSCSSLRFETSQPNGVEELKVFPRTFIGNYVSEDKKEHLRVDKSQLRINEDLSSLGDESILKMYNGYYVLTVKDRISYCQVFLIKKIDQDILVQAFDIDQQNPMAIKKLKEILPVKEVKNGNDVFYLINPTKEEFQILIDKNLFLKTYKFIKVK